MPLEQVGEHQDTERSDSTMKVLFRDRNPQRIQEVDSDVDQPEELCKGMIQTDFHCACRDVESCVPALRATPYQGARAPQCQVQGCVLLSKMPRSP